MFKLPGVLTLGVYAGFHLCGAYAQMPDPGAGTAPALPQAVAIEAVLKTEMAKRHIPGAQLAIVRGGKIIMSGAYGAADLETGAPVTPATVFSLNSATKSFTGVAIMQLVQQGKLSLQDPASRYVDDLPLAWRSITLSQFLTHTSGVPDVIVPPKGQGTGALVGDGSEDSAWATVKSLQMDFPAGTQFRYNQTNYVVLGKVIDRVSGMPFVEFIRQGQFAPLGLAHAAFGDARDIVPMRTRAYRYAGGRIGSAIADATLEHAFDDFTPFIRTAGGLNATATEVAQWLIGLQTSELLDADNLKTLWSAGRFVDGKPTPWAMGWPLDARAEHPVVAGIGGRRSAFFVYPQDDLAIVVLTNLAGAAPETFIDELAGQFYPDLLAANGGGLSPQVKRLRKELLQHGFGAASKAYTRLKRSEPAYSLSEDELNRWGGRLMQEDNLPGAVSIFALNVELYPASANTHDSLGEAYEATGEKNRAIASYRKSVSLDPSNSHAIGRIESLEGGQTR